MPPLPLPARRSEEESGSLVAMRRRHDVRPGRHQALSIGRVLRGYGRSRSRRRIHSLRGRLALSPSCALTYILGSVVLGWAGEAERAIGGRAGACASARSIPGPLQRTTRRRSAIFIVVALRMRLARPTNPTVPIQPTVPPMYSSSVNSYAKARTAAGFCNCTLVISYIGNCLISHSWLDDAQASERCGFPE